MRCVVERSQYRHRLRCGCVEDGHGLKVEECERCARCRAATCLEEAVLILRRAGVGEYLLSLLEAESTVLRSRAVLPAGAHSRRT